MRSPAAGIAVSAGPALLLAIIVPALSSPLAGEAASASRDAGKRIYRQGVLPSGEELRGTLRGDVTLTGSTAACANCHRRSGMGTLEGDTIVRPLAAEALFTPSRVYGAGTFPTAGWLARSWPPYTEESLARAIREGIDPEGRTLDPVMPRYALGEADMAALISHLKSLSIAGSPGVTDTVIRFATVVDGRVDAGRREAMLDVLRHYFDEMSAGTRNETGRAEAPPPQRARKYRAYRKFELEVWTVTGPEEGWEPQLEAYYRERPVFALLSGISASGWEPVQRFAERFEIPCVFPNVDLPPRSGRNDYTVYFSRGLVLEAEVLARHLQSDGEAAGDRPVIQVFRDDEEGRAVAAAFRESWTKGGARLEDRKLEEGEALGEGLWRSLLEAKSPPILVLWLRNPDLGGLGPPARFSVLPRGIYLSAGLGAGPESPLPEALRNRFYLVHPFALSGNEERRLLRTRAWLRARKISAADERLQLNTFFAASLTGNVVVRMLGYFSREYFLERVESMTEDSLVPTAYPHVSLGPGQRYASKGGYVLRYPEKAGQPMVPTGGWIVP